MVTYVEPKFTVDNIVATGSSISDAAPIPRSSSWIVLVVDTTNSASNSGLILPDDAQVGDLIEFLGAPATGNQVAAKNIIIYPPSGVKTQWVVDQVASMYTLYGISMRYLGSDGWLFTTKQV